MIEPQQIFAIVIALIMFVITIFIVGVIVAEQNDVGAGPCYDETFVVTDPAVDQSLSTSSGMAGITLTKYNGVTWSAISSAHWSYNTNTGVITVDTAGL